VRDGILAANVGLPAVALVTTAFWDQGAFVARAAGMPDVPRVQLPHPVAGTGTAAMRRVAADIAPTIVREFWAAA
jgi:hypothetical protein